MALGGFLFQLYPSISVHVYFAGKNSQLSGTYLYLLTYVCLTVPNDRTPNIVLFPFFISLSQFFFFNFTIKSKKQKLIMI